jgi:hypothetical protein
VTSGDYHCNYFIFTVTSGDYHCNYFIFTVTSGDYHCNYFIFTSGFPWAWVEEGLGCLGFLFLLRLQKQINIYCYSKISRMKICVIIDGLLSQSESVQVYQCFTVWNLVISDPLMFLSQFFFIYMFCFSILLYIVHIHYNLNVNDGSGESFTFFVMDKRSWWNHDSQIHELQCSSVNI